MSCCGMSFILVISFGQRLFYLANSQHCRLGIRHRSAENNQTRTTARRRKNTNKIDKHCTKVSQEIVQNAIFQERLSPDLHFKIKTWGRLVEAGLALTIG